jgi:hypothetical protein
MDISSMAFCLGCHDNHSPEDCPLNWMKDMENKSLALDTSLEKPRALHRVWRALNDGDCPSCHSHCAATEIVRSQIGIECPACGFYVTHGEIEDIETMFAPAMNAAVKIFMDWRAEAAKPE